MNRYQESLERICNRMLCGGDCLGDKPCSLVEPIQELIDKANKYDELLSILEEYNVDLSNIREILVAGNMAQDWKDKANKYDEKETPKEPIKKNLINSYDYDEQGFYKNETLQCPICGFKLLNEYECID